jgi:hypothetical protein
VRSVFSADRSPLVRVFSTVQQQYSASELAGAASWTDCVSWLPHLSSLAHDLNQHAAGLACSAGAPMSPVPSLSLVLSTIARPGRTYRRMRGLPTEFLPRRHRFSKCRPPPRLLSHDCGNIFAPTATAGPSARDESESVLGRTAPAPTSSREEAQPVARARWRRCFAFSLALRLLARIVVLALMVFFTLGSNLDGIGP